MIANLILLFSVVCLAAAGILIVLGLALPSVPKQTWPEFKKRRHIRRVK